MHTTVYYFDRDWVRYLAAHRGAGKDYSNLSRACHRLLANEVGKPHIYLSQSVWRELRVK